jgi:hypothetical protein
VRIIELRHRVHITDLRTGRQYYHSYHRSNGNDGYDMCKFEAEEIAEWISEKEIYLATVEEYEIQPTDEEYQP